MVRVEVVRIAGIIGLLAALPGCAFMPGSGPVSSEVVSPKQPNAADYEIVDITGQTIDANKRWRSDSLARSFGARRPAPETRVGVGDVVSISIWEASGGGLFGGRNANFAGADSSSSETLPAQSVARDGKIKVPYVGQLAVAGKTPTQIAKTIEDGLQGKAIDPQVLVTLQQQASASVVVVGDLTGAGRVNLNVKGDRLLEVIAQAGGIKAPPHETFIRITRGKRTATMQLTAILSNPAEDVFMQPGDTVYVFRQPQTFTALGAVKTAGELPIDRDSFTLAQAVGVAGGLTDMLADSSGIFVFRYEQPAVVRALNPASTLIRGDYLIPVIYRLNFRDPAGYFLARAFPVRAGDIVYVANAPGAELSKFLRLLQQISSIARSNGVVVAD